MANEFSLSGIPGLANSRLTVRMESEHAAVSEAGTISKFSVTNGRDGIMFVG